MKTIHLVTKDGKILSAWIGAKSLASAVEHAFDVRGNVGAIEANAKDAEFAEIGFGRRDD